MNKLQQQFLKVLKDNNTSVEKHCVNTSCLHCKYFRCNNNCDCPLASLKKEAREASYREMRKELEIETKTQGIIKIDVNENFGGYIGRITDINGNTLVLPTDDEVIWCGGQTYTNKNKQHIINLLFVDASIFGIEIIDIIDSTIQHSLLDDMENNLINVYDICLLNWIIVKKQYLIKYCNRTFTEQDQNECKCFHREQVKNALLKNNKVSDFVVSKYDTLEVEVKLELERAKRIELERNLLSSTDINLNIGDKLLLEDTKVTFIKQDGDDLYFRIYKKHKKCIVIKNNTMIKHSFGW